jgi:hypothetical protein
MAILKGDGEHGSDPLARRAEQYYELEATRPQCETTWKAQDRDPEHPNHRCGRYTRHGANHRCNCGTTRKVTRVGLLGRQGR